VTLGLQHLVAGAVGDVHEHSAQTLGLDEGVA
jgi:hypothetical protein